MGTATVLLTSACGILGPDLDTVGTVTQTRIGGGCWGIRTEEGLYEPLNLADRFRVDGLRVVFTATVEEDARTPCQFGPVIRIESIRRLDGS